MTTIKKQNSNHTVTTLNKDIKVVTGKKFKTQLHYQQHHRLPSPPPPIARLLVLSAYLKEETQKFVSELLLTNVFSILDSDPMIQ